MLVEEVMLGDAVGGRPGQDRVALEEVAVSAGGGATVARVLGDLVGADARRSPVKEVVVRGSRGMAMEKLRRGGGHETQGNGNGDG